MPNPRRIASRAVLDWLLEDDQPTVRYLALRDLLGKSESDPDVRAAKRAIIERGWAADLFADRQPGGWWVDPKSLYPPKYISTNWKLLILSDLGVDRTLPMIRTSCELWMRRFATPDGSFGPDGGTKGHLCTAGNTARAPIKFGYEDHPAVRRTLDWLVKNASHLGGWSC